jgi:hypothetical protein
MIRTIVVGLLSFCAVSGETSAEAFTQLRAALVGEWEAVMARGSTIRVSYRVIAADSALVETFRAGVRETLTIYHPDGPQLIATHYCAQGNQPQLRLLPARNDRMWQFAFQDATNLADPAASHLTRIRFQVTDPDHIKKTEVYTAYGKQNVTVFSFVRVRY